MKCLSAEYDFKTTKLNIFNKNGQLKDKYKCLPYLITLSLSEPINPLSPPNQPDPANKQTVVNSTTTNQGWLNYNIIQNVQPNIIEIFDNTMYFTKFSYNYRITVDVINVGTQPTTLRFMAQNPFSLLASNMNDVYGDETVFNNLYNGKKIKFTVTGDYQFFFIYYNGTDFNFNITINIDYKNYPPLVCKSKTKNCNQCYQSSNKTCNKSKCNCFIKDGNGYLKIKNDCEDIIVPVYKSKTIGNLINKYLYPEFAYLRDLFYNVTLSNSLALPDTMNSNLLPNISSTILRCGFSGNQNGACNSYLWGYYQIISGNLLGITPSLVGCPYNQIFENQPNNKKYEYSWNYTPNILKPFSSDNDVRLFIYYWYSGGWQPVDNATKFNSDGSLPAGSYSQPDQFRFRWMAFWVRGLKDEIIIPTSNTFDITVNEL